MPPAPRSKPVTSDIRNQPAYTIAEAARYLKVPAATLRTWVVGRDYVTSAGRRRWERLIAPADSESATLSFWNMIEAHVLWALRRDHKVTIPAVREALVYAERKLGVERLLIRKELSTSGRALFLRHYGQLIDLSASGQLAMEHVLKAHLQRVEWDEWKFPVRLYPFSPRDVPDDGRIVAIDPAIAFGRPMLRSTGVPTAVLVDRIDAGESLKDVAADYDLDVADVQRAIVFERVA